MSLAHDLTFKPKDRGYISIQISIKRMTYDRIFVILKKFIDYLMMNFVVF